VLSNDHDTEKDAFYRPERINNKQMFHSLIIKCKQVHFNLFIRRASSVNPGNGIHLKGISLYLVSEKERPNCQTKSERT